MRNSAHAIWDDIVGTHSIVSAHSNENDTPANTKSTEPVSTTAFDSTKVTPGEQFDYWHSIVANMGELERPDRRYDQAFTARSTNYFTSSVLYARHSMETISKVNRSQRYTDDMEVDALAIQLRLSGGVELSNSLKSGQLFKPGDIRILDLSQPFCSSALQYENLAIVVSKRELQDRLPGLDKLHGVTLANTPITQFLKSHLHSVMEFIPYASQIEAEKAADASIEMLRASLMNSIDANALEGEIMDEPVMRAVRMYINNHLHKHDLNPQDIAVAVGVSRAKLFRICKPYGTPMELVRYKRMRRAKELLNTHEVRSVEEAAFRVGYENRTSFGRTFRQEFGFVPSDLL